MSQLIALIIAIALGAIVTAIGFVFLGDAFTKNSERGVALQFVSQASQVEMAMTAHRAENAKSAYKAATTGPDLSSWENTSSGLVAGGYLKDVVIAPFGTYDTVLDGSKVYLVANSVDISQNVCLEIQKLRSKSNTVSATALAATPTGAELTTAMTAQGNAAYACFDGASDANVFVYRVE